MARSATVDSSSQAMRRLQPRDHLGYLQSRDHWFYLAVKDDAIRSAVGIGGKAGIGGKVGSAQDGDAEPGPFALFCTRTTSVPSAHIIRP